MNSPRHPSIQAGRDVWDPEKWSTDGYIFSGKAKKHAAGALVRAPARNRIFCIINPMNFYLRNAFQTNTT